LLDSIDHFVQKLPLRFPFSVLAVALLQAQNNPSQNDGRQIVFTTISGPVRNAVVYAPNPVVRSNSLPQNLRARGVFKMDLDNGIPYDVRVVQSTGYKILDDAAVETLRTWRFRPHRLVWASLPLEFRAASSSRKR
jgi:TonB family protein